MFPRWFDPKVWMSPPLVPSNMSGGRRRRGGVELGVVQEELVAWERSRVQEPDNGLARLVAHHQSRLEALRVSTSCCAVEITVLQDTVRCHSYYWQGCLFLLFFMMFAISLAVCDDWAWIVCAGVWGTLCLYKALRSFQYASLFAPTKRL